MRVLFVSYAVPYPVLSGADFMAYNTLRGLAARGVQIDLLCLDQTRGRSRALQTMGALGRKLGMGVDTRAVEGRHRPGDPSGLDGICQSVQAFALDTGVRPTAAAVELVRPRRLPTFGIGTPVPYWISRFADDDVLTQMSECAIAAEPYDAIHCETLFTACYGLGIARALAAHGRRRPTLVYRSHNVEWQVQQTLAEQPGVSRPERSLRSRLARQARHFEKSILQAVDATAAISDQDGAELIADAPGANVVTIDPGVSVVPARRPRPEGRIGFIGGLSYAPNLAGLTWFVEQVWPLLRARHPDVQFHVAGRGGEGLAPWLNSIPGVEFHGEVEDAQAFVQSMTLTVSPIHSGGGVRIKILEGLASGSPMVSTRFGVGALPLVDGEDIVMADSAAEFADACAALMADPVRADALGMSGQQAVAREFSWDSSAAKLVELYATR